MFSYQFCSSKFLFNTPGLSKCGIMLRAFSGTAKLSSSPSSNNTADLQEIKENFQRLDGGGVELQVNDESGIAFIKINHVDKKNAFSGKMMVDLHDAIGKLEAWKTGKGVILYGTGGTFCSGGYLETVKKICNSEDGYRMATLMHNSLLRLRNLPLISASLLTGKAIGGGAEIALATDFRLICPSAELRFVEARMGVGTGWGGGTFLQQLVGRRTALDLLLTCRKVSADEALVLGLADDLIEEHEGDGDEILLKRACEWMDIRVKGHHHSVVHTVKGIVNGDSLEIEREIFSRSWGGQIQQEALNKNIKHN